MSTAYSVEDGLVEGLESPEHSWVIGLQCHPERKDEVPRSFANLFAGPARPGGTIRGGPHSLTTFPPRYSRLLT